MHALLLQLFLLSFLSLARPFPVTNPASNESASALEDAEMAAVNVQLPSSRVDLPASLESSSKPAGEIAYNFLTNFGYINESVSKQLIDAKTVAGAISEFQKLAGLKVTGILDNPTLAKMTAPRCGVPDIGGSKKMAAFSAKTKWNRNQLKYFIMNEERNLRWTATREAIRRAFGYWSEVANIYFYEVSSASEADLKIDFTAVRHGDGYDFDGPGGVLAHAFFPMDGRIHFDSSEHYTEGKHEGTNLRMVGAHEIGHALGLDHSREQNALMYPYYSGYDPNFKLDVDDIRGIQSLYGPRAPAATTTTTRSTTRPTTTTTRTTTKTTTRSTTRPTTTTTRTSTKPMTTTTYTTRTTTTTRTTPKTTIKTTTKYASPTSTTRTTTRSTTKPNSTTTKSKHHSRTANACKQAPYAVFMTLDGNVSVLIDYDFLWRHNKKLSKWETQTLGDVYKNLPGGVRGGLLYKNLTWFFRERNVWAFKGTVLEKGFPKRINDSYFPSDPNTVIAKDGIVYALKEGVAYAINLNSFKVEKYDRQSNIFVGLPDANVNASLAINGIYYIFKNDELYKFNEKGRLIEGFPKKTRISFYPCTTKL